MQDSAAADHPWSDSVRRGARVPKLTRLVGVYDADGTAIGELRYFVAKLFGTAPCALCDLTHGTFRRRSAFDACTDSLPVEFELFHRNDQPDEVRAVTRGQLPCVVGITDDGAAGIVINAAALAACKKDVTKLRALLNQVVAGGER